ncbi:osteoclast-associated immunoglobulin-like receptor isoform 2-T2 [Alca torda]
MMLPVMQVLAFGAWLMAQSKATPSAPTISIFQKPPGVIPPGGSTTICCSCQRDNGYFDLYKNGAGSVPWSCAAAGLSSPSPNATQNDTGAYSCHYRDGDTVLAHSETLEIQVQEFRLPKPVLSVLPGHDVAAGADVVFRCTIAHPKAGCFLYLEGWVKEVKFISKDEDCNSPMCIKAMRAATAASVSPGMLRSNGLLSARPWIWWCEV